MSAKWRSDPAKYYTSLCYVPDNLHQVRRTARIVCCDSRFMDHRSSMCGVRPACFSCRFKSSALILIAFFSVSRFWGMRCPPGLSFSSGLSAASMSDLRPKTLPSREVVDHYALLYAGDRTSFTCIKRPVDRIRETHSRRWLSRCVGHRQCHVYECRHLQECWVSPLWSWARVEPPFTILDDRMNKSYK